MLRDGGKRLPGLHGYAPPTDAERARWRARREAERPAIEAAAIRARENWYAGGYHLTVAEQRARTPAWALDEGLLNLPDNEPADLNTTPDLLAAMTPKGHTHGPQDRRRASEARPHPAVLPSDPALEHEAEADRSPVAERRSDPRAAQRLRPRAGRDRSKPRGGRRMKPDTIAKVISDLEREIARLLEAKARLEKIR